MHQVLSLSSAATGRFEELAKVTVFNVEQIDGLPEIYYAKVAPTLDPVARIDRAETFFASLAATIKHGGNRAYYAQELDYVQMPPFEVFRVIHARDADKALSLMCDDGVVEKTLLFGCPPTLSTN